MYAEKLTFISHQAIMSGMDGLLKQLIDDNGFIEKEEAIGAPETVIDIANDELDRESLFSETHKLRRITLTFVWDFEKMYLIVTNLIHTNYHIQVVETPEEFLQAINNYFLKILREP